MGALMRSLPLKSPDGVVIATIHLITLFIPYAVRKPWESRPPLLHMAAILGDVPLLKRAVDIENRGELWNFKVCATDHVHPSR